jgi:hypothetical protein
LSSSFPDYAIKILQKRLTYNVKNGTKSVVCPTVCSESEEDLFISYGGFGFLKINIFVLLQVQLCCASDQHSPHYCHYCRRSEQTACVSEMIEKSDLINKMIVFVLFFYDCILLLCA